MFAPDFIAWLADFRLPEYELRTVDGQFELTFDRPLDAHHDVGDPGARHRQRAAQPRRC